MALKLGLSHRCNLVGGRQNEEGGINSVQLASQLMLFLLILKKNASWLLPPGAVEFLWSGWPPERHLKGRYIAQQTEFWYNPRCWLLLDALSSILVMQCCGLTLITSKECKPLIIFNIDNVCPNLQIIQATAQSLIVLKPKKCNFLSLQFQFYLQLKLCFLVCFMAVLS